MSRKTKKPVESPEPAKLSVLLPVGVAALLEAYADAKRWSKSSAAAHLIETGLATAKASA